MPFIPLTNSELMVEVDDEDYLYLMLLSDWYDCGPGYARTLNYPQEFLHHLVAKRMGLIITDQVDHLDRNSYNSKRNNIRLATRSQQTINQKLREGSTSGEKNIVWDSDRYKWKVHIKRNGKLIYIGRYRTLEEAIQQRNLYIKHNNLEFYE